MYDYIDNQSYLVSNTEFINYFVDKINISFIGQVIRISANH